MGQTLAEMAATVAAVPLCAYLLPGVTCLDMDYALMAGGLLAVIYLLLRPLVRLLTKPLGCITLGLMGIVVDTALVELCVTLMDGGFYVASLPWALAMAVIVDGCRGLLGCFFKK